MNRKSNAAANTHKSV